MVRKGAQLDLSLVSERSHCDWAELEKSALHPGIGAGAGGKTQICFRRSKRVVRVHRATFIRSGNPDRASRQRRRPADEFCAFEDNRFQPLQRRKQGR
jgi:hypothetical protein